MALLDKLFHRSKRATSPSGGADVAPCPHTTLVPRWSDISDMGHEDRATSFTCEGCGRTFSGEEGRALRAQEAERVGRELSLHE